MVTNPNYYGVDNKELLQERRRRKKKKKKKREEEEEEEQKEIKDEEGKEKRKHTLSEGNDTQNLINITKDNNNNSNSNNNINNNNNNNNNNNRPFREKLDIHCKYIIKFFFQQQKTVSFSMTKDILAIPDFHNDGILQSVSSDLLLRSLTVCIVLKQRSEGLFNQLEIFF